MAISAAAAPNSWSSPAKNVWLVDARPRDIVYRDARCGGGKIKLVLSFRVSLFCFCNNFSDNVITATSSVSGLFFQWLKYAFYFFCRFLPCTFILVWRGCEESAFNAAQQNSHAFSGKNTIRDVEAVTRSQ